MQDMQDNRPVGNSPDLAPQVDAIQSWLDGAIASCEEEAPAAAEGIRHAQEELLKLVQRLPAVSAAASHNGLDQQVLASLEGNIEVVKCGAGLSHTQHVVLAK